MELVTVEMKASKELREVAVAVENLVVSVKAALADGFQPGSDIPAIVLSAFKDFSAAIEGADKIGDEFKGDIGAALNALAPLPGKIAAAFVKKA
jgi:hypothetical protein